MRSLTRLSSLSRRLAATISKSFHDVWERAAAIAVAQRPDARDVGAQLIVYLDIAVRISGNAGLVEAEVVRVRPPADSDQQVRSNNLRAPSNGFDLHRDRVPLLLHTNHFAVESHVNAFFPEEIGNRLRDVFVFARDKARSGLNYRHLAPEAAIRLPELKSDVAAAQDNEMWGEKIHVHHRAVGEVRNLIEAGDRGNSRARTDIDEDAIGSELGTVHCYFLFRNKASVVFVYGATFQRL